MTVKELYEWAVKNGAENYDIEIDRDEEDNDEYFSGNLVRNCNPHIYETPYGHVINL